MAIPGKIIKISGKKALILYSKSQEYALIGDEKINNGDYVLVQMGIIIKILSFRQYQKLNKMWS